MLFQWYFHGSHHHPSFYWTLFTSISLLALPLSLFLLCLLSAKLFRRRSHQNEVVSSPPTRQNVQEGGEETTTSSSMVSSSEDDEHQGGGGDSGSNRKREFVICAVCASRLVVTGRSEREQGDFIVCASSLVASSGANGKTGEAVSGIVDDGGGSGGLRRKEGDFVVCTSSLVDQSGGNKTGEDEAEGKSRKKVEFTIGDGKSSSAASAAIADEIGSSPNQEIVTRTSKSAVQNDTIGTGTAAIIDDPESAVDEFFSCVSGMVPVVTTGSEGGAAIDLVRLSTGEVEEEQELGSCSKLLMAIDRDDDDDEQEEVVVNASSSLAPVVASGGETGAAIGDGKIELQRGCSPEAVVEIFEVKL